MWRQRIHIAVLAVVLTLGASVIVATQSPQPKADTYTWSGELVSVDPSAKTITVKSRVVYNDAVSELKQFKAGEKVWIVWSGVRDYSDGIRQVRRFAASDKSTDDFMMPAELVSPEAENQYIAIRISVPDSSLAALKAVNPGQWVTVTARHRPATDADAVVAAKPYVAETNANTSTN